MSEELEVGSGGSVNKATGWKVVSSNSSRVKLPWLGPSVRQLTLNCSVVSWLNCTISGKMILYLFLLLGWCYHG